VTPPYFDSASQVTSDAFNKDYQETSSEVSQIPNGTSDNPDIPRLRPNSKIYSKRGETQ
jgi:hypothetical protein